jgi:hypothetical protein
LIGVLTLLLLLACASLAEAQSSPYPASTAITGLSWDFAGAVLHQGAGSDLWPFAWLSNDSLVTAYGDGGGFNGANTVCRTHFGMHTVTGTPPSSMVFANTWGCTAGGSGCATDSGTPIHNAACDASFGGAIASNGGVPDGLTAVGNILYSFVTDRGTLTNDSRLVTSSDGGQTWSASGVVFTHTAGDFAPTSFVTFGAGQAGQPAAVGGFLYVVGGKVGNVTQLYLARVPTASITTPSAWQWITSTDPATPVWGAWTSAQPIFTDATAVGNSGPNSGGTMQYLPVPQRYVLFHMAGTVQQMHVFDAPNPWGPWTTVYYSNSWGPTGAPYGLTGGQQTSGLPTKIIPKSPSFLSADNKTFWLAFSGFNTPTNWDNLNLIKGTLTFAASPFTETFPTDGPITSNQNLPWTVTTGAISVSGGAAVGASSAAVSRARSETALTTRNQFLQGTVKFSGTQGTNSGAALSARFNATTDSSMDLWLYTSNAGASYQLGAYLYTNGVGGARISGQPDVDVTSLVTASNGSPVLRFEIAGIEPNPSAPGPMLMKGYLNGVQVWSSGPLTSFNPRQPTAAYDGNTRIGFLIANGGAASSSVKIDDISYGDFAPGGTPSSCQQLAVAAGIDQAADGGTVTIPAGQCTTGNATAWTENLKVTKRLIIQGAGIDQTVIQDNRDQAPVDCCLFAAHQIFEWTVPNTGLSSLSGMTWQGSGKFRAGDVPDNGIIAFYGDGAHRQFRLHHLKFVPRGGCNPSNANDCRSVAGMMLYNIAAGVIDNNIFDLLPGQGTGFYNKLPSYLGVGTSGDNSWAQPSTMGTVGLDGNGLPGALYVETNQFLAAPSSVYQFGADGWAGQRIVYRNNIVKNTQLANHGTDSGGRDARSARHYEFYNNAFTFESGSTVNAGPVGAGRGGTGVMFNNTVTVNAGAVNSLFANVSVFRAGDDPKDYAFFGKCDGTSAWDGNTGAPGGYPCLDQSGRGQGDLISGANPTPAWPHQAAEPIYAWNNTINGTVSPLVVGNAGTPPVVQEGRDFYNCTIGAPKAGCLTGTVGSPAGSPTPKAGYTPFTYPHPLAVAQTTVPSDPGAPVIGSPTIGPATTTYPITWDPSVFNGSPVTLYQYNGGYSDAPVYSTTPTASLNLVLPNRPVDSNAYLCVQGDAGGVLSANQSCTGFFVPAVVVPAAVRSVILSWTSNGGDGFTIQRKDGHCLVPGTFSDLVHVTSATPFVDVASPFPYACYHARATQAGASDSANSNDDGSYLPLYASPVRGLRRR